MPWPSLVNMTWLTTAGQFSGPFGWSDRQLWLEKNMRMAQVSWMSQAMHVFFVRKKTRTTIVV